MINKKELYNRIKIAGMLSLIPLILSCGVFAGYILGGFLEKSFSWGPASLIICMAIGLISAIAESWRLIRLAIKIDKRV